MKTLRLLGRALPAAFALIASAAAHAADYDQAAWFKWRAETEGYYSAGRFAVLKASDARYLKPGESVYLSKKADGSLHLSMEASSGDVLSVAYDGEAAEVSRDGEASDFSTYLKDDAGYPVSDRYELGGGPTQLKPGVDGYRVILFDQDSPEAKAYRGSAWFDFNKNFVFDAAFTPAKKMEERVIQTERGLWRQFFLAGHARVQIDGKDVDLPLYARSNDPAKITYLFVSFTDETSGYETYGVGRYLDFTDIGAFPPKRLTVDFNRAYNPYCARSPHYNCPLALAHVPVRLTVGEKAPH